MNSQKQFPSWNQLPELELYLDQVLLYVNQFIPNQDKSLTASMINNYVKHGQLEKPFKKKYKKNQIARLIVITSLKHVFSIQEISQTLQILTKDNNSKTAYNHFVNCMNKNSHQDDIPEVIQSACQTLKLYYQTHQLVLNLEGETNE